MARKKSRKSDFRCRYNLLVNDWDVRIHFNNEIYQRLFDDDEFVERIYMEMSGKLISTTSKKCNANIAATIDISPNDFWYQRDRLRDDLKFIGSMSVERADSEIYQEDTICFRVSVPTKSYENMKDYLSYKGNAYVTLYGTELFYRRGEVYSLEFGKQNV